MSLEVYEPTQTFFIHKLEFLYSRPWIIRIPTYAVKMIFHLIAFLTMMQQRDRLSKEEFLSNLKPNITIVKLKCKTEAPSRFHI